MSTPDARRGSPDNIGSGNKNSFPLRFETFSPGTEGVVQEHAANFPIILAQQMPINATAEIQVQVDGQEYPVQLVKSQASPYTVSVGFRAGEFMMDAHVLQMADLSSFFGSYNAPFLEDLSSSATAVSFEVITKINDEHFLPFRAARFLPWALNVLEPYNITHVVTMWEPDSDNHSAFYNVFNRTNDRVSAARATWSYARLTELGCDLNPKIGISNLPGAKPSPYGYPSTVVTSAYTTGRKSR